MKIDHPPSIQRLISDLKRLPGIGPKSAERLAYYLLSRRGEGILSRMADDLRSVEENLRPCKECGVWTEGEETCAVCRDPGRDRGIVCVVEHTTDMIAVERTGGYKGLYHVLGGSLSPLDGRGPEQLNMASLKERIRGGNIKEVLLATDADVEGEATAVYIVNMLKEFPVKVSRLACGIPQGGDLSFIDEGTLAKAIAGRVELKGDV